MGYYNYYVLTIISNLASVLNFMMRRRREIVIKETRKYTWEPCVLIVSFKSINCEFHLASSADQSHVLKYKYMALVQLYFLIMTISLLLYFILGQVMLVRSTLHHPKLMCFQICNKIQEIQPLYTVETYP